MLSRVLVAALDALPAPARALALPPGVPPPPLPSHLGLIARIPTQAFYGCTSVLLSMLNKALLSSYDFPCFFIMLAVQLAISLVVCRVSRDFLGNPFAVPKFDMQTFRV